MSMSKRGRVLAAIALAALLALPALAQDAAAPAVARMTTSPGSISWAPEASFDKLVLTVKGGGYVSTREFDYGRPYFEPVDDEGYQLPDGTYSWELSVIPPALDANNQTFRSETPSEDGLSIKAGTAPEGLVQSGSFTIVHGAIVDSGLVEAEGDEAAPRSRPAVSDVDDSDAANQ